MPIRSSSPGTGRGVLDDGTLRYCGRVMRKVCGDFDADLREFNGQTDHGHLPVNYPPKVSVPALVNSSRACPSACSAASAPGQ
jgi:putative transposase